jgi:hypothetical protein
VAGSGTDPCALKVKVPNRARPVSVIKPKMRYDRMRDRFMGVNGGMFRFENRF